jgi:CheY-like chemotaxis protein
MELLNKLRRDDTHHIPIIILTGDSDKLVHQVTEQIGAVAVMTKPVSAQELLSGIEKAVGFSMDG